MKPNSLAIFKNNPTSKKAPTTKLVAAVQEPNSEQQQYYSSNKEFFMSVGSLGNRSQPDDFMITLLYNSFNEPIKTMSWLQLASLVAFVAFGIFAT